jgi:hypothetical protein
LKMSNMFASSVDSAHFKLPLVVTVYPLGRFDESVSAETFCG